jgi:hypothetical protein
MLNEDLLRSRERLENSWVSQQLVAVCLTSLGDSYAVERRRDSPMRVRRQRAQNPRVLLTVLCHRDSLLP